MMRALAERYGPGGSFWSAHPDLPYDPVTTYEVWNEPNLATFWCPRPDPAAYARIYLAAHQAIHAADPEATVLLGGLAPVTASEPQEAPTKMAVGDFLARAIQEQPGLPEAVDAVAVHPYAPTPGAVLRTVVWFRKALSGAGLGVVPMSVNEFGWPTRGSEGPLAPVAEATRARYIVATTRPGDAYRLSVMRLRELALDGRSKENQGDVREYIDAHREKEGIRRWMAARTLEPLTETTTSSPGAMPSRRASLGDSSAREWPARKRSEGECSVSRPAQSEGRTPRRRPSGSSGGGGSLS